MLVARLVTRSMLTCQPAAPPQYNALDNLLGDAEKSRKDKAKEDEDANKLFQAPKTLEDGAYQVRSYSSA